MCGAASDSSAAAAADTSSHDSAHHVLLDKYPATSEDAEAAMNMVA